MERRRLPLVQDCERNPVPPVHRAVGAGATSGSGQWCLLGLAIHSYSCGTGRIRARARWSRLIAGPRRPSPLSWPFRSDFGKCCYSASCIAIACTARPLPPHETGGETGTGGITMDGAGHDRSSETSSANRDASGFMAVSPCLSEAEYVGDTATITFGFNGAAQGFSYDPKCLRIQAGQTVTFSGSFAAHPLTRRRRAVRFEKIQLAGPASGRAGDFSFRARATTRTTAVSTARRMTDLRWPAWSGWNDADDY